MEEDKKGHSVSSLYFIVDGGATGGDGGAVAEDGKEGGTNNCHTYVCSLVFAERQRKRRNHRCYGTSMFACVYVCVYDYVCVYHHTKVSVLSRRHAKWRKMEWGGLKYWREHWWWWTRLRSRAALCEQR